MRERRTQNLGRRRRAGGALQRGRAIRSARASGRRRAGGDTDCALTTPACLLALCRVCVGARLAARRLTTRDPPPRLLMEHLRRGRELGM